MASRGRPRHNDVLTPAEWRVVNAVRHGMSNRTIARRMDVSLDAVKFHVRNAIGKLGLVDRRALRMWRGAPFDSALAGKDRTVATLQLGAIGQIARSVEDIAKAEAWYRDVLGLAHMYTYGKLAFFDCDGTRLFLEERGDIEVSGLKNDSLLYFRVPDINAAYDELQSRGVTFVDAPHMIFRHPDGTEEWMAFFQDCDGGMLALMSQVSAS
jgi:DNA-binding CsgD family transcriptional regulator/catechol 2,3-dioxygenase-like lactoylglutathione lyase family enzyme